MKDLGVILTVGMTNSGKSTFAREFVKENPMYVELNRDDIRHRILCDNDRDKMVRHKFSKAKEDHVTDIIMARARYAVSCGQGIIVSDTNLSVKTRNFWKKFAEENTMPYEERHMPIDLHVAKERNRRRDLTLPSEAVRRQYNVMCDIQGKWRYTPDVTKPLAMIVDLDGTTFHTNGRDIFDYESVDTDIPDDVIVDLINMYAKRGVKLLVFSGREDIGSCRSKTLAALNDVGVLPDEYEMRPLGDRRPDVHVKEEFLKNHCENYNIFLAVDDRDQVVDLWRFHGIKTLQVDYGDF